MKHYLFLLFATFSCVAYSPRLLIFFKPEVSISIKDVAFQLNSHIIEGDNYESLKDQINACDMSSLNHRVVVKGNIEDVSKLARKVGYEYIIIGNEELLNISQIILEKEKSIPVTDIELPHMDVHTAGLLYDLMIKIDAILKQNKITYWATAGTLLGAIRHEGLVPWDDDLDINIFEYQVPELLSLKFQLEKYDLIMCVHPAGFYKIFPKNGRKIKVPERDKIKFNNQEYFDWKFPFIDIFPMALKNGKIEYASEALIKWFPNEYFEPPELILPFFRVPFGPMDIPIPHNSRDVLTRFYGEDWNEVAYAQYSHEREDFIKKVKVHITERDPISYILPVE